LVSLNLPAGKYAITATTEVVNKQVFDSERATCAINGQDETTISLDSAGISGHKSHGILSLQTAASFSGKVTLACYADDDWHAGPSTLQAIAVDNVVATSTP
jgi:hypothetical protein